MVPPQFNFKRLLYYYLLYFLYTSTLNDTMLSTISYDKIYEGLEISHDAKVKKALKKRKLKTLMSVIDTKNHSGQTSKGWRRLKTLRVALDSFKPFERTRMQKRFHHAFMQATAMHLFRDDTDVNLARVMAINGKFFSSTFIVNLTNKDFFS